MCIDGNVIPLNTVGISDNDGITTSIEEMDQHTFRHLFKDPNAYIVRSGGQALKDFNDPMTLMKAHPILFPYGRGGFVEEGDGAMSFLERVQWCLQFQDKRFRHHRSFIFEVFAIEQKRRTCFGVKAQMRRSDFVEAARLLRSITEQDMQHAASQELEGCPVSHAGIRKLQQMIKSGSSNVMGSDKHRIDQRPKLWGLTVRFSAPWIWFTYSLNECHDPVVQVFIGEDIDLDHFNAASSQLFPRARAQNVARDPYAAAKYFQTVTIALFERLLGVTVHRSSISTRMGVLGMLAAYFASKETQGRGGLHGHSALWQEGTPAASRLENMFKDAEFRSRVTCFLEKTMSAYLEGVTLKTLENTNMSEQNPSFARPPDPSTPGYKDNVASHLQRIVINSQVHVCRRGACLVLDRYGREVCKRRVPFPLSEKTVVNEDGTYLLHRTVPMLNNFNPSISTSLMCNNDVQLITSGSSTNDISWYIFGYMAKKQGRSYNQAALLASKKLFPYVAATGTNIATETENARRLLNRCMNTLSREQELAGPLVITYLMGWGDTIESHHFVPMYWKEIEDAINMADSVFRTDAKDDM